MSSNEPRDQLAAILRPRENWHPDDLMDAADAILSAGWRPPPRVIETPENEGDYTVAIAALDSLAHYAVIRVRNNVYQSVGSGWWETIGRRRIFSSEQVVDVADGSDISVLHEPEEER